MQKIAVIISILISSFLFTAAQNQGNFWSFGYGAGLDFNTGIPISVSSQLSTLEGCASISDNNGNLLFYSDGSLVYNKDHFLMPNGSGLLGHSSSSQSAIIVKKPGSSAIYYLFTVDGMSGNAGGLFYSEIDMDLDGGLGDVNSNKNINLIQYTCEKVTAVKHQNNIDFWIISRERDTNKYYAFLLSSLGINLPAVQTNIGPIYNQNTIGYLKASPDGTMLAAADHWGFSNGLDLFEFDRATGILSNNIELSNLFSTSLYGVEFSPSGQYLYVSEEVSNGSVYQYDLMAGTYIDINNSKTFIGSASTYGGALQLGPDQKIYHADNMSTNLGVINSPNLPGLSCNYIQNGVTLNYGSCGIGLPTFFSSIFSSPVYINSFTFNNPCLGDTIFFNIANTLIDSVFWDFGDPNSGVNNNSIKNNPFHVFSTSGTFYITLYSYFNGVIDTTVTVVDNIFIPDKPIVDLGNDTAICKGETLSLDVSLQNATYIWQDSSTSSVYDVFAEGEYFVKITVNGCSNSDTINIVYAPVVNLGNDTVVCEGEILTLDVTIQNATYLWQDNSTNATYDVFSDGEYFVEITLDGCSNTDTINVDYNSLPNASINGSYEECYPETVFIDINFVGSSPFEVAYTNGVNNNVILGDNSTVIEVNQSGTYEITNIIDQFGCIGNSSGSAQVIIDACSLSVYVPNSFIAHSDSHNNKFMPLIYDLDNVIEFSMKIFNRWGGVVFETKDVRSYWDGTVNNTDAQKGLYAYIISIRDVYDNNYNLNGSLFLIR